MKYMALYVEVIPAGPGISDDELRSTITGTLSGVALRTRDGSIVGRVVHAQVTEGPNPTLADASPRTQQTGEDR